MKHPDDYASPQAPFSGDPTGDIFSDAEILVQSPVTSARIVETQSGYTVVVTQNDGRLSLTVKRRIGTPPSSQILLTSDESIKLSRVLNESAHSLGTKGEYYIRGFSGLNEPDQTQHAGAGIKSDAGWPTTTDLDDFSEPLRKRRQRHELKMAQEETGPLTPVGRKSRKLWMVTAGSMFVIGVAVLIFASTMLVNQFHQADLVTTAANPMRTDNVDRFVRNYVANLLDFNPRTYKISQIQAMACMEPTLLEKYWRQTSFPLSKRRLKRLPAGRTVVIKKVVQEAKTTTTTDVDLFADLAYQGKKKKDSIHLKISLGINDNGSLIVMDQKDVSGK